MPSDFENSIKEFMSSQKNFNALIEEKLLKIDDLARNVDRISLDVDSLMLGGADPPTPMGTGPLSVRWEAESAQRADRGSTRGRFYPALGRTDA